LAKLPPLVDDSGLSVGAYNHARYLVENGNFCHWRAMIAQLLAYSAQEPIIAAKEFRSDQVTRMLYAPTLRPL